MSEAQTKATEQSKGLYSVEEHTVDGSHVRGVIENVDPDSAKVTVQKLTTGDTFTEPMDYPETWDEKYKFVDLVESNGYGSASPELLEGDHVTVDVSGSRDTIVVDESLTISWRVIFAFGVGMALSPVMMWFWTGIGLIGVEAGLITFLIGLVIAFLATPKKEDGDD